MRQDSVLFDHARVRDRPGVGPWRPWLPATGHGVRWRWTCPLCALQPDHGLLLMAQLPIMLSCPEHGCRLLPAYHAVQQYPGGPEPEIADSSEAVKIMDRCTHEGVTTGQVTLPRRTVHVGVWFRLLRTVLHEVNTPMSYLRRMTDKETLTQIWQAADRPVRPPGPLAAVRGPGLGPAGSDARSRHHGDVPQ